MPIQKCNSCICNVLAFVEKFESKIDRCQILILKSDSLLFANPKNLYIKNFFAYTYNLNLLSVFSLKEKIRESCLLMQIIFEIANTSVHTFVTSFIAVIRISFHSTNNDISVIRTYNVRGVLNVPNVHIHTYNIIYIYICIFDLILLSFRANP